MREEFRVFLREVASRFGATVGERGIEEVSFDVTLCPHPEEGVLASDIAFKIARFLQERTAVVPDPVSIAEKFVTEESPYFRLSRSELGHLNADLTRGFTEKFLRRVNETGAECLFQGASFVVRDEPLEPLIPLTVHTSALSGEDIDTLRTIRSQQGQELSREDLVMMLALAADREIDVNCYLRGLSGRQNVPWYLNRFLDDSLFALRGVPQVREGGDSTEEGTAEDELLSEALGEEIVRALVDLRGKVRFINERPWYLMGTVLSIVRGFYRDFNDPGVRAELLQPTARAVRFCEVVRAARLSVDRAVSSLHFVSRAD